MLEGTASLDVLELWVTPGQEQSSGSSESWILTAPSVAEAGSRALGVWEPSPGHLCFMWHKTLHIVPRFGEKGAATAISLSRAHSLCISLGTLP